MKRSPSELRRMPPYKRESTFKAYKNVYIYLFMSSISISSLM